jgi:hypothetical protein
MNSEGLKGDLQGLKDRLQVIEEDFKVKLADVEKKNEKYASIDKTIADYLVGNNNLICLNIGGKIFKTKLSTLLSEKDTFFYYIVAQRLENKEKVEEEMFFDRSYANFDFFMDYLRTKRFSLINKTKGDLDELSSDANYYGFSVISDQIEELMKEVTFVNMDGSSAKYSNCGNHNVKDLHDKDLNKGITVQSPYTLIIEFNMQHTFKEIEVGGFNGNTNSFAVSNGANAKIYVSNDKINWGSEVGTLPNDYGNKIQKVTLKSLCTAKYIKFQHNSYIGMGYLNIIRR